MNNLAVIIVAGGSGKRMLTETPKQFLPLGGRPMLFKTIEAFSGAMQRVVVLPAEWVDSWRELCVEYGFGVEHDVVEGGSERFFSVVKGLKAVRGDAEFVAVHDGVRPFVSVQVIENALFIAQECGCAIPVVEVSDSVRMANEDGSSQALLRSRLRAVQTPQIFRREILQSAYKQIFSVSFTDDASVVESAGYRVALSRGDVENIKITYKNDLKDEGVSEEF